MAKRLSPQGEAAPPVEPNVASAVIKKQAPKKASGPKKAKAGVKYVRNIRNINVRATLDSGKRIELEARGNINDLAPLTKDEEHDGKVHVNVGFLWEIIDAETATAVIAKQSTNASHQRPALYDHLLNSKGDKYEVQDIHIHPEAQRTIIVGQVTPDSGGRFTDANAEGQVVRTTAAGPQQVQVPGSPGHPATNEIASLPDNLPASEVAEFVAWKRAQAAAADAARQMGQA